MKYIIIPVLCLILFSCTTRLIPLRGKYPQPPFEITTTQQYEQMWNKVVDVFTERNIPIKIIDKSSGLIVSDKISMGTTVENRNGVPVSDKAFIVVPGYYDPATRKNISAFPLDNYSGSISVRVKTKENNVTVSVSISGVTAQSYMSGKMQNGDITNFKSTGKFEQSFFDLLK